MCSGKCVRINVMAGAVLVALLMFAMAAYSAHYALVCGITCHLGNHNGWTNTVVPENCNDSEWIQWTKGFSSNFPVHSSPVRLRTVGLSKLSIFPILIAQAQPQRHFRRIRWHPYIPNANYVDRDLMNFPQPLSRMQLAGDQQVPEMDELVELPTEGSQSDDHVVPVVEYASVFRRYEQPWQELLEQVVPGVPNFGGNEDRAELPVEEPSFQDLEAVQIVPQLDDDLPDDEIPAINRQPVIGPLLENLHNFFRMATATLPWIQPLQPLSPASQVVRQQLENFRAQGIVLESMPAVLSL